MSNKNSLILNGRLVSPKREEQAVTDRLNESLRQPFSFFLPGHKMLFPMMRIDYPPDDIPEGLFAGPGARLSIQETKEQIVMSHYTKKERIEILETKIAMLKEQLADIKDSHENIVDRFNAYIGEHLAEKQGERWERMPANLLPAGQQGILFFGELQGVKCICWHSAGFWFTAMPNEGLPVKIIDIENLFWYKKIS